MDDKPPDTPTVSPFTIIIIIVVLVLVSVVVAILVITRMKRKRVRAHETWIPPTLSSASAGSKVTTTGKDYPATFEDDDDSKSLERKWGKRFKPNGASELLLDKLCNTSRPSPEALTPPTIQSSGICDVNTPGPGGLTPLMVLAMSRTREDLHTRNGRIYSGGVEGQSGDIIFDLCTEGASVNTKTDFTGETPLHLAARYGHTDAVKRLLDAGADPNIQDSTGRTPLDAGVAADAVEVVKLLLNNGKAKVNSQTNDGTTCLMSAARLDMNHLVRALLSAGANVDATDSDGRTALHWAAAVNNLEVAMLLLRHGAKRDLQDGNDETPLFLAVKNGQYEMAKLLLENLANSNIPNDMNQMPRDIAAERRHGDIVELLDNFRLRPLTSVTSCQTSDVVLPTYVQHMVKKKLKTVAALTPNVDSTDNRTCGKDGFEKAVAVVPNNIDAVKASVIISTKQPDPDVQIVESSEQGKSVSVTPGFEVNCQKSQGQCKRSMKPVREIKGGGSSAENTKYPRRRIETNTGNRERRSSQKSPGGTRHKKCNEEVPHPEIHDVSSSIPENHYGKSSKTLSCEFEAVCANRPTWTQQNQFDENRNFTRESNLAQNIGMSIDSHTGVAWPGTLSPPDSTCCVSPNAGSSSVGSPGMGFPVGGTNVQSPGMNCISIAPVTFYSNSQSPVGTDLGSILCGSSFPLHTPGAQGLTGNHCTISETRHPGLQPFQVGLHTKEVVAPCNHQNLPLYPMTVTPNCVLPSSAHVWDTAAVQYQMINICLTPSPDNSPSFQLE